MAIHPHYADAILAGEKLVEFRKRQLASDITTVLIYATWPVQKVVGEFRIKDTVIDSPDAIWDRYGTVGTIERADYSDYYEASARAVAIVVEHAIRYARPHALSELHSAPAIPQSFSYIHRSPRRYQPLKASVPGDEAPFRPI